uniref:NADH-ubiquinone oxidoreductase chain 6 n=1 Tax=Placozoa sp. H11 HM-2017 TaxID=2017598 RepID=A0A7I6N406_9METZ|nr:NADH dehydrogenase subunit 6 [Placozoa sp. H11 HM-2017]
MTIGSGVARPRSSAVTPTYSHNFLASVFWLILTFIGSSGLFIVLGMEFLGLIFLIVYVGAICIIFLFVIMMIPGTDQKDLPLDSSKDLFFNYFECNTRKDFRPLQLKNKGVGTKRHPAPTNTAIGVLIGAILAAELASAVPDSFFKNLEFSNILNVTISTSEPGFKNPVELGQESISTGFQNFIYTPAQFFFGGPDYNDSFFTLNGSGGSNLEAIGSVLYINYYYAFILVSFILLVAMIGAIVLGLQSSDQN